MKVLLALIICLRVLTSTAEDDIIIDGDAKYKIKPFHNAPGLYFENVGDIHLVQHEWHLVIFTNLESLANNYKKVLGLCSNFVEKCVHEECLAANSSIKNSVSNVMVQHKWIQNILGLTDNRRQKRGLFNSLGTIQKLLFGTLDTNDGELIYRRLSDIEGFVDVTKNIFEKQQSILEKQVKYLYELSNVIEIVSKTMNENFKKLYDQLNKLHTNFEIFKHITKSWTSLNIALDHIVFTQDKLLEILIAAIHGETHPYIISIDDLKTELQAISRLLPSNFKLPPFNDLNSLYDVIKTSVHYSDNELKYLMKIPLVTDSHFKLFKMTIMPKLLNDTYMTFVLPSENYIAVDFVTEQYFLLSKQDLQDCSKHDKSYLCDLNKPIFKYAHKICELELLLGHRDTITEYCNLRITRIEDETFISLADQYSYIYIYSTKKAIKVKCNWHEYTKYLEDTGVINISQGCRIETDHVVLKPKSYTYTNKTMNRLAFAHFSENLVEFDLTLLPKLPKLFVNHDLNMQRDELDKLSYDVEEYKKLLSKKNNNLYIGGVNNPEYISSNWLIILTISLFIVVILLAVMYCFLMKRIKSYMEKNSTPDVMVLKAMYKD